jgi:hypothetical protein
MKRRRRYILIGLAVFVLVPVATTLICVASVASRNSEYPDFTHFQTASEVQIYLEENLTVGLTTTGELQSFLSENQIFPCYSFKDSRNTPEPDLVDFQQLVRIRCTVLAPPINVQGMSWINNWLNKIITLWNYELVFQLSDSVLTEIFVWSSNTSL